MNIVKETRFVWFVVLLFVVFAFAAHKKGDYDPNDNDHAFTESPPPPPVAPTSCFPGFAYGIFTRTSLSLTGSPDVNGWDSGSGPYPAGARQQDGDIGTNGCAGGSVSLTGGAGLTVGDVYYGAGCPNSTLSTSGGPSYTGQRSQTTNQTLPSVVVPPIGSPLGPCAACVITPDNTYTILSGAVTLPAGTYVVDTLDATAAITVSSGPVLIYVNTVAGFTPLSITNTTGYAANLVIEVAGAGALPLNQSGTYALYAPDADITLATGTTIFGSVVGNTLTTNGNAFIHYDRALKLFAGGGYACTSSEVSRSSPIIATVGGVDTIVQGTFNTPTAPAKTITSVGALGSWVFPYVTGHFRSKKTSALTVAGVNYATGVAADFLFDAADNSLPVTSAVNGKPIGTASGTPLTVTTGGCGAPGVSTVGLGGTALNGSCRRIFTNIDTPDAFGLSWHPHVIPLSDPNANTIGALMITNAQVAGISGSYTTIIDAILNGKLGGVDRSTAAVIGPSTVAGNALRPTIAYVGGTDGMLHAFCASTGGTTATQPSVCPRLGAELWAFLPRVELPLIASNTQRIDGSPRVVDVFGDFSSANANVTRSWHTILMFQTGFSGVSVGASYALDITDPAAPYVVWEYGTPAAVGAVETGVGLVVAAGAALKNGQLLNTAVMETNNGGNVGAGVVATSLQIENGARLWQFGYPYPDPPRSVLADDPMPNLGVPGGAVAVDLTGQGTLTDVVFGDLYGDLWRLNILDGTSRNGLNTPLFSFSTNKRPIGVPPAIYADASSNQYAAFASGGFVDPIATRWSGNTQYLVSVKLTNQTGPTVSEVGALPPATVCPAAQCPINTALTSGDREYGQLLVVGGQLFLTSDGNDVNTSSYSAASTSHLMVVDTTTNAATTYVLTGGGAGSLVNKGTSIYNATATQQGVLQNGAGTQVSATAATDNHGVDTAQLPKITRNLWLRTQ